MFTYSMFSWKASNEVFTTCSGPINISKIQKCVTIVVLFLQPNECDMFIELWVLIWKHQNRTISGGNRERGNANRELHWHRSQKILVPIQISTYQFYELISHLVYLDLISQIYKLKGCKKRSPTSLWYKNIWLLPHVTLWQIHNFVVYSKAMNCLVTVDHCLKMW